MAQNSMISPASITPAAIIIPVVIMRDVKASGMPADIEPCLTSKRPAKCTFSRHLCLTITHYFGNLCLDSQRLLRETFTQ